MVGVPTDQGFAKTSMGADGVNHSQSSPRGRFDSAGGILEILDGRVDFERFRQVLRTLWTHPVFLKTVVEVQNCQWVLRQLQWVLTV